MNLKAHLNQKSLSVGVYPHASSSIIPMMVRKCLLRELTARPEILSRTRWAEWNYCLAGNRHHPEIWIIGSRFCSTR